MTRITNGYLNPDGTPQSGTVKFTLVPAATDSLGVQVTPGPVIAEVDDLGILDVELVPDSDLVVDGEAHYVVEERVGSLVRWWRLVLADDTEVVLSERFPGDTVGDVAVLPVPGPTAVSGDAGNAALLGGDGLIFVPEASGGGGGVQNLDDLQDVEADPAYLSGGEVLQFFGADAGNIWIPVIPAPPGMTQEEADARYVNLDGDSMAGPLQAPSLATPEGATLSGDSFTSGSEITVGPRGVSLYPDSIQANTVALKLQSMQAMRLLSDQPIIVGTRDTTGTAQPQRLTNLADGADPSDAVTKRQLDTKIGGADYPHNLLGERYADDAHPITAITGLVDSLERKADVVHYHTADYLSKTSDDATAGSLDVGGDLEGEFVTARTGMSASGHRINNVADPMFDTDAMNKGYADATYAPKAFQADAEARIAWLEGRVAHLEGVVAQAQELLDDVQRIIAILQAPGA